MGLWRWSDSDADANEVVLQQTPTSADKQKNMVSDREMRQIQLTKKSRTNLKRPRDTVCWCFRYLVVSGEYVWIQVSQW
jgi:hypothetical protein